MKLREVGSFPDAEDGPCEIGRQVGVGGEVPGRHGPGEKEPNANLTFSATLLVSAKKCSLKTLDQSITIDISRASSFHR